tara:strand:+ start:326 stop:475 length:150 start_codon:yes stop_codon:yes gene_type:complete
MSENEKILDLIKKILEMEKLSAHNEKISESEKIRTLDSIIGRFSTSDEN